MVAAFGLFVGTAGVAFAAAQSTRNDVLGLPPDVESALGEQNARAVALGRQLFFDKRLSANGTISCASCHVEDKAFSDGRVVAKWIRGKLGTRNTPSLINTALMQHQFWDGRRSTLESQATDPLFNPLEHGLSSDKELLQVLRTDSRYRSAFRQVFGVEPDKLTRDHAARALAAFERTLIAGGSPFDRYQYAGDKSALSPGALRGLTLFRGAAQCTKCHAIGERDALFTDHQFHSLGIGFARIAPRLAKTATTVANASKDELDRLVLADPDISELGRFVVTKQPMDIGKFKTPSLRNVALTAPYMHDGSIKTLEEAVEFEVYYRNLALNKVLALTNEERADIVEFLNSLTSPSAKNATSVH